ncbi:DUF3488 and transglutaminase-like domain-containing protein [Microbacterium sp. BG28]|uniref:transglutaminase family protein n=1 Tax=Microbacterium sp. BG28 TaxID=3097356 RepID=UPI002A5A3A08|nr:DUF3488 and transglutaminase-like domain-containing protein [Microbacterium sp. BG28]MDY0827616.1 DUF3488 and transglutaminase-like domain-containing protein [Microbacterium sp. BG28]
MPAEKTARAQGQAALAVGVFVALIATTLPVMRVIAPGAWVAAGFGLAAVILALGAVLRRVGVAGLVVTGIDVVVWVLALTLLYLRDSAWGGLVPSPASFDAVSALISSAVQEMAVGAAPLTATPALSFFVVAAIGALTIVLDHVVITTRMPLLAAIALVAVAVVPTIAVPAAMDVFAFVLLAASILFLLATDTRTRRGRTGPRGAPAAVSAALIAVASIAVAVIVTPLLPAPDGEAAVSGAGSSGINPTLRLGDDLRRPNPVEVLRVRSSEPRAPYLRAVTLSSFAGEVWRPDERDATPVGGGPGFGPVRTDPDVSRVSADTKIDIVKLNTPYLPIPFPATAIGGLTGDWGIVADNRTVVSQDGDSRGQSYEVITETPTPTLEQIRAATSRGADVDPELREIPDDTPANVSELARAVTAETSNDYDAAFALQRWFRSSAFTYSLDAPVQEGFDGAGVDAIGQFLEVRSGYCVHFASAFAAMTRSLGMPTRIVIGYLPGTATTDRIDGDLVYSVSSDLLHSWPEVYFEGIGWVPFEPTNSLGVPTVFSSGVGTSPDQIDSASPEPTEAATPTAAATERPDTPDSPQAGTVNDSAGTGAIIPAVWVTIAAILLLAAPALAHALRGRRRLLLGARGDASAAWLFVEEAAIDLGLPVPASASPRALAERLIAAGAPAGDLRPLVDAIEHASYAPASTASSHDGSSLAAAASRVRRGLMDAAAAPRRILAVVAPRSLVIRPGTTAAGAGWHEHARRPL